jgi:hypothetical protein
MRVEAHARESELAHVGAADDHRARRTQARHHGRVFLGRRRVVQCPGARERDLSCNVAQVLDRDRDAGKWRGHDPGLAQHVAGVGRGQRLRLVDLYEGTFAFALGVTDTIECLFGQRA